MKYLFALSVLFITWLSACPQDFQSSSQKVFDSKALSNTKIFIPLGHKNYLYYSGHEPHNMQILKYDPFLSLYLIKNKTSFPYPFKINMHYNAPLCIIDQKGVHEGTLTKRQRGLNSLATFSTHRNTLGILSNSCGFLEGIVTFKGIIQKAYLKHFIETPKVEYSDIGIRVKDEHAKVLVSSYNPFKKIGSVSIGDTILELDGKEVKSASSFLQNILFSNIGMSHRVKLKHHNSILKIDIKSFQRFGGGAISDTFLEAKGLYFDEKLSVVKVVKEAHKFDVKVGDRLLQVNGFKVKNQQEVREYISHYEESALLLFERHGFQFFVKIN